jgi:hypothetical protein
VKTNIALAIGALILLAMLLLTPGAHAQSNRWDGSSFNSAGPDWATRVAIAYCKSVGVPKGCVAATVPVARSGAGVGGIGSAGGPGGAGANRAGVGR